MQIAYAIIVMYMQHLQPEIKASNKILEIQTNKLRMARIEAKSQQFRRILVIKTVYSINHLMYIAAWAFYYVITNAGVDILKAQCQIQFFGQILMLLYETLFLKLLYLY